MRAKIRGQFHRQFDEIVDSVLDFIDHYANVDQYQEHLFTIFRDAYERGFCGPLRYRRYDDTLRSEWISTRPSVCGDTIWNYAVQKGYIHEQPVSGDKTDSYRRIKLNTVRELWDAWTYALHQLRYRHRCHRRLPKDPIPRTPIGGTMGAELEQ